MAGPARVKEARKRGIILNILVPDGQVLRQKLDNAIGL
jgi:hypothetical protein